MKRISIYKNLDYSIMPNRHLWDINLSLKAKGLLSMILSVPEDGEYTIQGLAEYVQESEEELNNLIEELRTEGYLDYVSILKSDDTYIISDGLFYGNNHKVSNKYKNVSFSRFQMEEAERMCRERENYKELIMKNICYENLCKEMPYKISNLNEIIELLLDTVCSSKHFIRISGENIPKEVVKSRFLKLDSEHIRYVLDCLSDNYSKVKNIRQYLLATLYNAPITISNYYSALVNHDMYGGSI